jgi:photosystem II stability/assembly factor-like uncharacterized protein
MIKTYYVNSIAGSVRRLDDFTGPWIDVSNTHTDGFLDVMAFPNDPEKVIVIGLDKGIYWSYDSGASWTQAVGDYTTLGADQEFNEIWIVDELVSYIAGGQDGIVLKSIDGGITYNSTGTYPTDSGGVDGDAYAASVHFINENVGIIGIRKFTISTLWKTINGGLTWVQLDSANFFTTVCEGVHLSANEESVIIQGNTGVWKSIDNGVSFNQTLDLTVDVPTGSGTHLTWFNDDILWVVGLGGTIRQSIDAGDTWNIIEPYNVANGSRLAAHFYAMSNGYIGGGNDIFSTDDGGSTTLLSETFIAPFAIWTSIGGFTPCYLLTDCAGIEEPIYTATDLSDVVGEVISLADDTNHEMQGCWAVTENLLPCSDVVEVVVYKCYTDCEDCLPPEPPIRTTKLRKVQPGYTMAVCDPAIVEKALCSYVDLMYQKMLGKRFMIENCCPKDDTKILIQYYKINALMIKDTDPTPDACNPICYSYQTTIALTDSAVTTYTDCFGVEQIIITPASTPDSQSRTIEFCALDSSVPTSVVTHPDTTIDTYVLGRIEECALPCVEYEVTLVSDTVGAFTYIDCNGVERSQDYISQDTQQIFTICGLEGQVLACPTCSYFDSVINGDCLTI